MRDLESQRSTQTVSDFDRETDVVQKAELAVSQFEAKTQYLCQRCQAKLTAEPEYENYDWFLRCLVCGARNLLTLSFQIVGWRR